MYLKPNRLHNGVKSLLAALTISPLAADVIPVDLPPPDDQPPAKDKPVKVFILSGQSNMLGFGKVEGSAPLYSSVFLSADPSVQPCKMPIDSAALLPLKLHGTADAGKDGATMSKAVILTSGATGKPDWQGSVALGQTDAKLPKLNPMQQLVVSSQFEVPYDGLYEIRAGIDESSYCTITVGEQDPAYQKKAGDREALLQKIELKANQRYDVNIEYHASASEGSAAFWMEKTDMEGMGDLKWVVEKLGRFPHLMDDKGAWSVRNDVMLNDAYMGKGKSDPLSAPACGPTFGPELGFGYVMGTYLDEPVIVMKADIGNRSLGWDILPPGSESYTFEGKNYPGYGQTTDPDGSIVKPEPGGWYVGKPYDDYTVAVRNVLDNFDERYPEYADQGFEVAGFVWWQGHKDGPNPAHNSRYEENLANLIKAWRKEFEAPNAKWAIATVGFEGEHMPEHYVQIADAQMAVADPERHPEFAGTVKTIDTRPFWRGPEVSPKNQNYHYNHNGETYLLTGDALGRAMVELLGGKVEYPPAQAEKQIGAVPYMNPPTDEELAAMTSALRPIILDKLIPDYVAGAADTPGYRRYGMALENIISSTPPTDSKGQRSLKSQLDKIIGYYNVAGVHTYDWKPFGPEMRTAEWQYFSFDPKEAAKKDAKGKLGDMYREVTLPEGMEEWYTADFDPSQAGWMRGPAPFGQNNGEQNALRTNCGVPHCGCDITPLTKWESEVLLIRQSFEVPDFKEGHRYRIIIGGAGHGWSGEGFALYLNGKLISEETGGYYKSGGDARGAHVFEGIKPEFKDGRATFAVKAFLRQTGHRGKPAPPSGHLSVWMEEAKLPPAVEALPKTTQE